MPTSLIILLAGAAAAMATTVVAITSIRFDPLDPELEKRALVRAVAKRPRLADFVKRRLDPREAGGLLLTTGFVIVAVLMVLVGIVFNMVDNGYGFARFDAAVSEYGAQHIDGLTADVAGFFTKLGGTRVITLVTAAAAAWGWWRYENVQVALFMITVAIGQALLNNGIKWLVDRDRPDLAQLAPWSGSSFPSGHSSAAAATYAALALVLTLRSGKWVRALAAGGAAFVGAGVGATRALLGVHWLTDVIAGIAVGLTWFTICAVIFGGRIMQFGDPAVEVAREAARETARETERAGR